MANELFESYKKYAQNFRIVYPFSEFGNFNFSFIEISYLFPDNIYFQSNLGGYLTDHVAVNGENIFGSYPIPSNYTCINEELEEPNGGWITVKELYGSNPVVSTMNRDEFGSAIGDPFIFTRYGQLAYSYPRQIERYSSATYSNNEISYSNSTFDGDNNLIAIGMPLSISELEDQFPLGSLVRLYGAGYSNLYNDVIGEDTTVQNVGFTTVNGEQISLLYLDAFIANVQVSTSTGNNNVSVSGNALAYFCNSRYLVDGRWQGSIYIQRRSEEIPAKNLLVDAQERVAFFTSYNAASSWSELNGRWKPIKLSTNSECDYVGFDTNPTRALYNRGVSNGTYISAQDPVIERVYQSFYKCTAKYIKMR